MQNATKSFKRTFEVLEKIGNSLTLVLEQQRLV